MQLLAPDASSLLQSIQRLVEMEHITWVSKVVALRLLHVDLLLQLAVDIGMRDVDRAQVQVLNGSYGKNGADGGHAHSRRKGFQVVKARPLITAILFLLNVVLLFIVLFIIRELWICRCR